MHAPFFPSETGYLPPVFLRTDFIFSMCSSCLSPTRCPLFVFGYSFFPCWHAARIGLGILYNEPPRFLPLLHLAVLFHASPPMAIFTSRQEGLFAFLIRRFFPPPPSPEEFVLASKPSFFSSRHLKTFLFFFFHAAVFFRVARGSHASR